MDLSRLKEPTYFQSVQAAAARLGALDGSVHEWLNRASAPVRFLPQDALPEGQAYEAFIHRTQKVPTRDNWHDLLNGLVWHSFPQAKRRLNALQAAEIARAGTLARTPLRDAATVFDENGAVLIAPAAALEAALKARDWQALFLTHRALWASAQLHLFGHALMEKLLTPFKAITAHVLLLPASASPDAELSRALPEALASKAFLPLPVMGVPLWCADNEDASFYADTSVFRTPVK